MLDAVDLLVAQVRTLHIENETLGREVKKLKWENGQLRSWVTELEPAIQLDIRLNGARAVEKSENDLLRSQNTALVELLRDLEWAPSGNYRPTHCPRCKAPQSDGHAEGCRLNAAISGGVVETEKERS